MTIELKEIYKGLEVWRNERKITAESQKEGYIVNVMEELGELATALRLLEKYKSVNDKHGIKSAEHFIIDAICDIAVFTINAGADIKYSEKNNDIDLAKEEKEPVNFDLLMFDCSNFSLDLKLDFKDVDFDYVVRVSRYNCVIVDCAILCEKYGFNFEIAMLETIKEINSRTGSYDENAKKWVKDESDEAWLKWYNADYEKARILQ